VLEHFKHALEVDVCYLMVRQGYTIALSNRHAPASFVGKNYSFRPYFKQAIQGAPSIYMALGVTSKKRGVYCAYPVFGEDDSPAGVAVIKAPIDILEKEFRKAYEGTGLLTDPNGVIFMSNRDDWLYHLLSLQRQFPY
jgi:C4-dicarboxylate-specific signal transduction histidine kinase